ncbi:MAG: TIGR00266 family protein [Crocinitomicaceae bacterium]|jgi:uncharacterized protein (TIGR00266 family)|nr:TIGR00266 family protein [Crocinitomicaceae bacterium]
METEYKGLKYEFAAKPDFGYVTVQIPHGETLKVEAGSMAAMDTNIEMKTKFKGGFSRFLTGESIFINEFSAPNGPGEIQIAPASPGDIEHLYLENETVYLQNSAFVASAMGINVESKWQGFMKGFFSGESFFLIRCQGSGDLWFNSYGGIIPIDVDGEYVIDTGHIVGFTDGLEYSVRSVGGYKSLFFSGEGLVCQFRGKGKVWIQTRKLQPFLSWIYPFRPVKDRS